MKPYRYPEPCVDHNGHIVVETDELRWFFTVAEWNNQGGE